MDNERFPWFQWKLARLYFLCLGIYALFIIIANWLAIIDILNPDNFIYQIATYGGSLSAFFFVDRCEKVYNEEGFLLNSGVGFTLFWVYVLSFVGVTMGVEKLFDYTAAYLSI